MLDEALAVAERAVAAALDAGASDADATHTIVERFGSLARDHTIEQLEQSIGRSLSMRVYVDGRKATLSTTELAPERVAALARETVEAARSVAVDPLSGLPDQTGHVPDDTTLQIYSGDVRARAAEDKLADIRSLEERTRAYDQRITNSGGSRIADSSATTALANSRGFRGAYRWTTASLGTTPIADDEGALRVASYGSASRAYSGLESVAHIATVAASRAIGMCGARKPATARVPVIFERDVAGSILSDIFSAINAANVAMGDSFLAGRIGDRIGSELITLVDDGLRPGGLGTSPFDAEGVPTRNTVVFERGTLRTFLYDTYYGRKLGAASTGNASGGSIGPNNFYLLPGTQSLEELVASTKRGVLVLDTIGFATEHVTGTYSRGARGMWIENGELAYPVGEFTIAGNLSEMLGAVDGVASDLVFDASIVAPSFRVSEMTVSGS